MSANLFTQFATSFSDHWHGRRSFLSAFLKFFLLSNTLVLVGLRFFNKAYIKIISQTTLINYWHLVSVVAPAILIISFLISSKIIWSTLFKRSAKKYQQIFGAALIGGLVFCAYEILVYGDYLGEIHINGTIKADSYDRFMSKFKTSWIKPKRVVVSTGGGSSEAALAIGIKMRDFNMDIEVLDYCMSACANYLLVAANNKYLHKNSLIMYHGNLTQENLKEPKINTDRSSQVLSENKIIKGTYGKETTVVEIEPELQKYMTYIFNDWKISRESENTVIQIEGKFYESIKVDRDLASHGQQGKYLETYKSYKYIGFYYSLEDLKSMGVTNIHLIDNEWRPEENPEFKNVYLVKLENK